MRMRFIVVAGVLLLASPFAASAQSLDWTALPDPRGEFVRLCAQHMVGRAKRPEAVCLCLHDYALATVSDEDMHAALMRGIAETGVPSIETAWIPNAKRMQVSATFNRIARPTMQCMFAPQD